MSSLNAEAHAIYQFGNAPLRLVPFPHFVIPDVFPDEYFQDIRRNLPERSLYQPLSEAGRATQGEYDQRLFFPIDEPSVGTLPLEQRAFWTELYGWMAGRSSLRDLILTRLAPYLTQRFKGRDLRTLRYHSEVILTRDLHGYQISPHTDSRRRAFSVLFYIPPDAALAKHGTSIYIPKQPGEYEDSHYPFDMFVKMATAPYQPNSAFVLPRLDNSFHGVEPVEAPGVERDILMLIVRVKE